ncbi:MAG: cation diffusion facilitator family transporter [Candidatus Nezhaarchaeota archaeon]|nr:cation diffusion facilitator family transporter [Candidatus Nezhaarchaeota archaeon]
MSGERGAKLKPAPPFFLATRIVEKRLDPRCGERLEAKVSIVVNVVLWAVKLAVGFVVNSVALVADAWHTMSDCVTSIIVFTSSKIASKPPDKDHPYGHGKAADIGSLLMSIALIGIACYVIYEAMARLYGGYSIYLSFMPLALCVFAVTGLVKEGLARYSLNLSKRTGSLLLKIDAWHHRVDALASLTALPPMVVYAFSGTILIDVFTAIVVGILILYEGVRFAREASSTLMDATVTRIEEITKEISGSVNGVFHVHDVRVRCYGGEYFVELKVHLPPEMSIDQAHELAHELESMIKRKDKRIVEVVTHVEPSTPHS